MNPDTATVAINILQMALAVLGTALIGQVRARRSRRKLYTYHTK